jgi:hypothetical protein
MILNKQREVSSWAGKKPKKPKQVVPKVVPVQDTQVTDKAARTAEDIRRRRGGVASTALSETLGG